MIPLKINITKTAKYKINRNNTKMFQNNKEKK